MTVVAWDGRYVAADSLEVSGSSRCTKPVQKIEVREGTVYAVSGAAGLHKPLIDWIHNHAADPEKKPVVHEQHQDTTVIVWRDGRCFAYDLKMPYPVEYFAPEAWGCSSAAHHVIGAMDSGVNARTAVERVIIRNAAVGGPVQVIDLLELQNIEKAA